MEYLGNNNLWWFRHSLTCGKIYFEKNSQGWEYTNKITFDTSESHGKRAKGWGRFRSYHVTIDHLVTLMIIVELKTNYNE
jgi:hypothetical protein